MRHAALLAAGCGLLLASCAFPAMSLEGLACSEDHACVEGYVCHEGQCLRSSALQCPPEVAASSAEVCDGVDNDCDGVVDDSLTAPACALTQGVCAQAAPRTCQGSAGWSACTYPVGYEQSETSCDGLDNDCDGVVDDAPGCMTTVAGDGPPGFRDGPAAHARFSAARYLTRDAQGRVWVADQNNHAIRRIDTDGTVTTEAGDGRCGFEDGPVATAKLCHPYDVEVAPDGTVYFSDFNNDRIRAIRNGQVVTVVGTTGGNLDGPVAEARLDGPAGIALLSNGDLLIADRNNHRIRRYVAATATVVTVAGSGSVGSSGGGSTEGYRADDTRTPKLELKNPMDVAEDSKGNLLISEGTGAHRIRKVPPVGGMSSTLAGAFGSAGSTNGVGTAAKFNMPEQLQLDEAGGALYVADSYNMRVRKVPLDGATATSDVVGSSSTTVGLKNGTSSVARLNYLTGMVRMGDGTWRLVDANGVIRSAVAGTAFSNAIVGDFAGGTAAEIGKDGPALEARMRRPLGLTQTADGTLYWVEREGGALRRLTTQGRVETVVGDNVDRAAGYLNGSLASARLNNPRDVKVGPDGRLYIAESVNHVLRVVDLVAGTVDTFAGPPQGTATADLPGYVDSDDPNAARFTAPRGLAFGKNADGKDVLYVTEELGCRVRMVELATRRVTTLAGKDPNTGSSMACWTQTTQPRDGAAGVAQMKAPGPIAVDPQGNVYVGDGQWLRLIRPDGSIATRYSGVGTINGVANDGAQLVLVTDQTVTAVLIEGSSVIETPLFRAGLVTWFDGESTPEGSQPGPRAAGAARLTGVLALPDRILLTDENTHRLRQVGR